MIGALRGTVIKRWGETIILDVNGVGYEVVVTRKALEQLQEEHSTKTRAAGIEIKSAPQFSVMVYTDVRENVLALYGFVSLLEREVFELLRKVKGIGPRTAMNIVSAAGAEEVLSSIGRADISALKRVSGVGPKTAERIIVELRERVGELVNSEFLEREGDARKLAIDVERIGNATAGATTNTFTGPGGDVVLALEKLGFPHDRARQVVAETLREQGPTNSDSGDLLRQVLARI